MANTQTLQVLQNPDGSIPVGATGSTGVAKGVQNLLIDSVTAATAKQIASFSGAVSQVKVRYFRQAQQLTGTYLVTDTVASIISNSNGVLQSLHVLLNSDGTKDPLYASTGSVYGISNLLIDSTVAATAAQIVTYPNALTQINTRYYSNAAQFTGTIIVTEALAAVQAASGNYVIHGNSTTTGSSTTAVTVTIGSTMANTSYLASIAPQNALTAIVWYISARTTTTFTVTFITAITGSINFDWLILP